MMRILTTICCVLAVVAMYGCGGSSQLSESAIRQDFADNANVRIEASGLPIVMSSQSKDDNFFVSDTFAGDGYITGDALTDAIDMDCEWTAPVIQDTNGVVVGDLGYIGATLEMVDDVANCTDLRACCVYDFQIALASSDFVTGVEGDDTCKLDIECVVDEADAGLAATKVVLAMHVQQYIETSMRDDSGGIAMAIEDRSTHSETGEPANQSIMDLSNIMIDRSACEADAYSGDPPANGLVLNDALDVYPATGPKNPGPGRSDDLLSDGDQFWDTDSIGAVDAAVGGVATCAIQYYIPGELSLAALAGPSPTTIEEYIEVTGNGLLCNSLSVTDCFPDLAGLDQVHHDWE